MSDHIRGFSVTLKSDMHAEDAEVVRKAILAIRHVASVEPFVTTLESWLATQQVKMDCPNKLWEIIR